MMIKMPDWEKERLQYPALQNQTYLMTAAAGPLSQAVYESYQRHFKELYENGDIHWLLNLDSIETSRRGAMSFIGAHCESEVAFTGNTSLTMNLFAMSFKSLLHSQNRELSVLTCKEEFPSTSLPWIHHGYKIHQVEARNLADALRERNPSIVLTSTVQYGTGFRQNLNQLGELCQQKSYFIVNATQSLGAFPLDVKKSRVTALSASCHKWMGCGFGICLLYLDQNIHAHIKWPLAGWLSVKDSQKMDNTRVNLHPNARSFETGVPPMAAIQAFYTQVKEINRIGIENISARILDISDYLVNEIQLRLSSVQILSLRETSSVGLDSCHSGIVLLGVPYPEELATYLAKNNIHVSLRQSGLRISTHFYNNKRDVDRLIECMDRFEQYRLGGST